MTLHVPRWLLLVLALLLAAGAGAGIALWLSSGEPVRLVADCQTPVERPSEITTACADAGSVAQQLTWDDWGEPVARAEGVFAANTCDPTCVDGGVRDYPVVIEASQIVRCGEGRRYSRLAFSFPADSPYPPGSPAAEDPTVELGCGPRPAGP